MKKLKLKPVTQEQQGQVVGGSIHDNGEPAKNWWNWMGGATCDNPDN